MYRSFAYATLAAATIGIAAPAFAQDAMVPEEISTAVEAAETTGVLDTLLAGGEVTVFVPTNEALAAAPQDALAELMADPERLAEVIQGYAVSGTVMAADVMQMAMDAGGMTEVETLGGSTLSISVEGDQVMVKGSGETMATVVTPDLQFGTITVHVIDAAVLPADAM